MKKNGFTFIELSVVMIILAILIGGSMPIGSSILRAAKVKSTQQKLSAIEAALASYLVVNGNLPCPALLTEVSGDANFGDSQDCSGAPSYTSGNLVYGAVPVRTLNMTNLSMSDAWDNKIAYVVDKRFTTDFATTAKADADITITTGGITSEITTDAVYILISPGKNSSGAFPINADVQINKIPSNTNEIENIYVSGYDSIFVDYEYADDFDDMVRFKTKMQMIFDISWEDVGCVGEEASSTNWATPADHDAEYGSIEDDGTYCRKCYKYSRWGNEYTTDCP